MEKVLGFGGLFIRSKDPGALAAWYDQHLGILPVPTSAEGQIWMQQAGPTVFSPFKADTDYFAADKQFMMNFRVANLDAMLDQLRGAGIEISHEMDMEGIGRFARIHDPEGNPIELWEPVEAAQ